MIDMKVAKKLISVTKPNTWLFIGSIGLIVSASLFEVIGISLVIPVLNSVASGGDFISNLKIPYLADLIKIIPFHSNVAIFTFLILLVMVSVLCSNCFLVLSILCASIFSTNFIYSLRAAIMARYLSFGKAFYDKTQLGSLMVTLVSYTEELGVLSMCLRTTLVNFIMAVAFLSFLFAISWQLTFFALPIAIVMYFPINWLTKKIHRSASSRVQAITDLHIGATDLLSNIALVRSYTNEDDEYKKFINKCAVVKRHTFNVLKKSDSAPLFADVIASAGFLILVYCCVVFYMQSGKLSIGTFMVFFFALRRFVMHLKPISEFKVIVAKIAPIIKNIGLIFDDSGKEFIKSGLIEFGGLKNNIVFKNVGFGYGKKSPVLEDISFTIEKGQTVAIVGPTGAGKTTIAHLLCRFYDCSSGGIEIDGIDIRNITLQSLRSSMALVAQDNLLFSDTIGNNIIYGMKKQVAQQVVDEAAQRAYIYDYIMTLPNRYDTYVGDKGVKLSGGEKQRISIARAILKDEDILILDEATSSLDSDTERLIQKAFDDLMRTKTVIAIAHRLSTIKHADWILVLENGKITEQGKLEDLLKKEGRFSYYWNLQKFH